MISNSLRYDLDQAALALTQLEPLGAVCAVLSLCALLVFPMLGFVLGVFQSTHDVRSGSIIVRWPQAGITMFASSKPLALVGSLIGLAAFVAVLTLPCAWIAETAVSGRVGELAAFTVEAPDVSRALAVGLLAVLTGAAFGALGLLVGAVTRNRSFTIGVFALAFFLVPLGGSGDPRNLLTVAGAEVLYFAGQFRPAPLGDMHPVLATAVLGVASIAAVGLSLIPWLTRSRTARHA